MVWAAGRWQKAAINAGGSEFGSYDCGGPAKAETSKTLSNPFSNYSNFKWSPNEWMLNKDYLSENSQYR